MKKTTSKLPLSKRLTQYGALTVSILAASEVSAQIEYTDVDPDFVGGLTDSFDVDFNNDSTTDISILQTNSGGGYERVQFIAPYGNGAITYVNAYAYAINLNSSAIISSGAVNNSSTYFSQSGSFCYGPGYTGSTFCGSVDGYLGVKFEISGNTHFGWVRLDVSDSSNFVVKDFAYNSVPDQPITAGQETLSVLDSENKFANIACVDRIVTISQLQGDANYRILSITGQVVKEGVTKLETQNVSIESLSSGIYIVEVSAVDSNAVTRKKIAI